MLPTRAELQQDIRRLERRQGDAAAEANFLRKYGRTIAQEIAGHRARIDALDRAATAARGSNGAGVVTVLGEGTGNGGGATGGAAVQQVGLPVAGLIKLFPWVVGGIAGWFARDPQRGVIFVPDASQAPAQQPADQPPVSDPGGILGGVGGIFNAVGNVLAGIPAAAKGIGGMISTAFAAVQPFAPVIAAVALLYAISAVFRLRVKVG